MRLVIILGALLWMAAPWVLLGVTGPTSGGTTTGTGTSGTAYGNVAVCRYGVRVIIPTGSLPTYTLHGWIICR